MLEGSSELLFLFKLEILQAHGEILKYKNIKDAYLLSYLCISPIAHYFCV